MVNQARLGGCGGNDELRQRCINAFELKMAGVQWTVRDGGGLMAMQDKVQRGMISIKVEFDRKL